MVKMCLSFVGRSSITRASSFFEIPDLTEKDALTYLTQRRNLSDEMAKNVYNLVGGRLKSLQNTATKIESGVPFSSECICRLSVNIRRCCSPLAIRSCTLHDIARRIEKLRCRANSKEETFIFNVLCGLLHKPELTVDELIHMEGDVAIRQKLLEELCNETILMRTVKNGSYTFHGQATKVCVEEFYKEKKCFHCKSITGMKF